MIDLKQEGTYVVVMLVVVMTIATSFDDGNVGLSHGSHVGGGRGHAIGRLLHVGSGGLHGGRGIVGS